MPIAGQRIGYARVSTLDRNEKRQLEGQLLDRVFTDKASGVTGTTVRLLQGCIALQDKPGRACSRRIFKKPLQAQRAGHLVRQIPSNM